MSLRQGSELDENRFIVLICDKGDIKAYAKELKIKLSDNELNKVYDVLKRKLSDQLMDQYWSSIKVAIEDL